MADPAPFIQSEWMHGFAPVILVTALAFAVGFVLFGLVGAWCHHTDDGTELDDLGNCITHGEGRDHDA